MGARHILAGRFIDLDAAATLRWPRPRTINESAGGPPVLACSWTSMRFTSLAVEMIRARPVLIAWAIILALAGLWFVMPTLFYSSPPGDVAGILATGREYRLGTSAGPPLAPWLADLAFRLAGGNVWGVYLLAQICFVVAMGAVFAVGRMIVGARQAALAIILTVTIAAFGIAGVEFGPAVLARPLWALVLLHYWRAVGLGRRTAWFSLSIEAGLLLLTTYAAAMLLALLGIFTLSTERGRRAAFTLDSLFALIVVFVLVVPHLIWVVRGGPTMPALGVEAMMAAVANISLLPAIAGGLALALAGTVLLVIANSRLLDRKETDAPTILRQPVDPLARTFVYFVAIAPALAAILIAIATGSDHVAPDAGVLLLPVGLAIIVAGGDIVRLRRQRALRTLWAAIVIAPALFVLALSFLWPWFGGSEARTSLPADAIGRFFAESYERRTGQPLPAVAGDPHLAAIVAMTAPGRPHLLVDATPDLSPWITRRQFQDGGGIIVWRAHDTAGAPPEDIRRRFPEIAPEVPRAFERRMQGRQSLLRVGWAIVRPSRAAANGNANGQPR